MQWGARFAIPLPSIPISVDQRRWRELGIDPLLGEPASAVGDAYMAMGAQLSFTCAPYLLDTAPKAGDQIVWAESNAVVYANSVLGARTLEVPGLPGYLHRPDRPRATDRLPSGRATQSPPAR